MQARARGAAHESTLMRCSDIAPATLSDHEERNSSEIDCKKLVYERGTGAACFGKPPLVPKWLNEASGIRPQPSALKPQAATLDPEPSTLNPQPFNC